MEIVGTHLATLPGSVEIGGLRMLTLRLTHHADTVHTVEVQLDDDGHAERAISEFPFAYKAEDRELVRWYLEDYIAFPVDPAPTIAARAEDRLALVGADLFGKVFGGGAARLWARVRPRLADVRIEVASDGVTLPWELLRDPDSDVVLALHAGSFVRATRRRGSSVPLAISAEALRVLIVISRPDAGCDVPFRSVARQLLRSASGMAGCRFDVLRPPTWDRLGVVLAAAHRRGVPYHAVHFDGHGEYTHDRSGGSGRRGYAVFEGPGTTRVDGATLGTLLAASGVGVLVLNACRSAHAEAPGTPQDQLEEQDDSDVEAYGSLADEVVDAGVSGVVAMQYNVFVDTAARFVGDLYQSILTGEELARGVTQARRRLAADPYRTIAYDSRPLQDWMVPVVFQAGPFTLVSMAPDRVDRPAPPTDDEAYAANTTPAPDLGFFGRDETLLELDRAFDTNPVVLLTAYAGAGKSATAMEFSRWYLATDGADLALWSSLVLPLTTVELLDRLAGALATDGIVVHSRWQELSLPERLAEVRRLLGARRLLWVWDNVETVGDDPDESLVSLLGELRVAKAKVLLTSRRDERPWLGDTVMRVGMPPMPMVERLQLARAVAERTGRRLDDIEDWRPLLRYTEGTRSPSHWW